MSPFQPEVFLSTLALIAAVIAVSVLVSGLIDKSGFPPVAIFLGLGALIGPIGLNLLDADLHSPILRVVATLSLVLVLFTDAVSLNVTEVRQHRTLSLLVLGPGTLLSAVLIALIAWWLLGLSAPEAVILGGALASTDPVLIRGLLRRPGVNAGVRQALRLESGMNDAVLLPMILVGMTIIGQGHSMTGREWAHLGLNMLVLSPSAGIVVGLAAVGMLELVRKRFGVRRDYESIYSLGVAFAAFTLAESVHGSGFLAAFAAGLTISALDVELCDCFLEYGETTAEMLLMFTFVLFGTSLIWSGLGVIGPATTLFVALVLIARPAAFIPALIPAVLSWKDRWLIAWFGPRGLSSLLLILLPVFAGIPGTERLLTLCCLVVLVSVVLHGFSPILLVPSPPGGQESIAPPIPNAEGPATSWQATTDCCPDTPSSSVAVAVPLAPRDGEYISIEEVKALRGRSDAILIIDARSERSYNESTENIPGAIRLHPDNAVSTAARSNLPKNVILSVICA